MDVALRDAVLRSRWTYLLTGMGHGVAILSAGVLLLWCVQLLHKSCKRYPCPIRSDVLGSATLRLYIPCSVAVMQLDVQYGVLLVFGVLVNDATFQCLVMFFLRNLVVLVFSVVRHANFGCACTTCRMQTLSWYATLFPAVFASYACLMV